MICPQNVLVQSFYNFAKHQTSPFTLLVALSNYFTELKLVGKKQINGKVGKNRMRNIKDSIAFIVVLTLFGPKNGQDGLRNFASLILRNQF